MTTPVLQCGHSLLRPWASGDATSLVRHANNIRVAQYLRDRFPNPYTRSDARTFLKAMAAAKRPTNFAIVVEGDPVGGIGYVPGHDIERYSAEVGYWLGEPYWGRGIVSEALNALSEYAFREADVLRLFALSFAENAASIRVLEKAGFAFEGLLRSSCVKYGQPRDQALYARVNSGWPGWRPENPQLS